MIREKTTIFSSALDAFKRGCKKVNVKKAAATGLLVILPLTGAACYKFNSYGRVQPQISSGDTIDSETLKSNQEVQSQEINNAQKTEEVKKPLEFKKDIKVPVLMYHKVLPDGAHIAAPENECYVSQMEEQLIYLKQQGYTCITLEQLYRYIKGLEAIPEKSFVITIDDGYQCTYKCFLPVLEKLDMHADAAIITDECYKTPNYNDMRAYMTWEQVEELQKSGYINVVSHTKNHYTLTSLSTGTLDDELYGSEQDIKKYLGTDPGILVIPKGACNSTVVRESVKEGYHMDVQADEGLNVYGGSEFNIKRFGMPFNETGENLIRRFEICKVTNK